MRKYFVHYYLSQRERKDRLFRKARTLCASSLCWRSFYLEKQMSVSFKVSQIVWGVKSVLRRLCQTKDLICIIYPHTFGLWVFNYFADFFLYVQYLFIVFVYYIFFFLLLLSIRSIYCSILLNLVEIYPTICSLYGWFFCFKKKIIIIIIYPLKKKKKKKNQQPKNSKYQWAVAGKWHKTSKKWLLLFIFSSNSNLSPISLPSLLLSFPNNPSISLPWPLSNPPTNPFPLNPSQSHLLSLNLQTLQTHFNPTIMLSPSFNNLQ